MKFNVSFGAKNVFSFDAKPVTNMQWWLHLLENDKPVSQIDHDAAANNPSGVHAFGTLERAKEICGEGSYVTYAV